MWKFKQGQVPFMLEKSFLLELKGHFVQLSATKEQVAQE